MKHNFFGTEFQLGFNPDDYPQLKNVDYCNDEAPSWVYKNKLVWVHGDDHNPYKYSVVDYDLEDKNGEIHKDHTITKNFEVVKFVMGLQKEEN